MSPFHGLIIVSFSIISVDLSLYLLDIPVCIFFKKSFLHLSYYNPFSLLDSPNQIDSSGGSLSTCPAAIQLYSLAKKMLTLQFHTGSNQAENSLEFRPWPSDDLTGTTPKSLDLAQSLLSSISVSPIISYGPFLFVARTSYWACNSNNCL